MLSVEQNPSHLSKPDVAIAEYLSPASFFQPDYLEPSAWIEHTPFAFWLVEALRPRSFVELGTYSGCSYFAVCQAVTALGLDTRCYAVDHWKGDEHAGFYGEEVFARVDDHNNRHYSAFSRLVRATFDQAVAHFADASVDLLHIDGRHFYEDIAHDLEVWRPKLSERAVVLLHDTNVRERDFGVFRLWAWLSACHPSFEFYHGHGLGVLGYGAELPEGVTTFLAAAKEPHTATHIRQAYARLGGALSADLQARQAEAATRELRAGLEERSAHARSTEQTLAATRELLAQAEAASAARERELQSRLDAASRKIAANEDALAEARERLALAEARLNERFGEIATLTRLLRETENTARRAADETEWMRQTAAVLLGGGSWRGKLVWLLPGPAAHAFRKIQLKRRRLFDARAYLNAHPDVARSGADPLRHYVNFGIKESRRRG